MSISRSCHACVPNHGVTACSRIKDLSRYRRTKLCLTPPCCVVSNDGFTRMISSPTRAATYARCMLYHRCCFMPDRPVCRGARARSCAYLLGCPALGCPATQVVCKALDSLCCHLSNSRVCQPVLSVRLFVFCSQRIGNSDLPDLD